MSVTRSTAFAAVELLIIGVTIVTYHNYDAEAVGPLKVPLNNMFKKERANSISTVSPKNLQTVSVLSQSSRIVSFQIETLERPATSPHSEEFTPFCAAASSNGAVPTRSRLSERYLYHLVTWRTSSQIL